MFRKAAAALPRVAPRALGSVMTGAADQAFEFVNISHNERGVVEIEMNRAKTANAFHMPMWHEMKNALELASSSPISRVVIITGGTSKHFTAGMDLTVFADMSKEFLATKCEGRKREKLKDLVTFFQGIPNAAEKCRVPVIAAVNGGCIGAGVDLITACDLCYATKNAQFIVKEIDLAITADVGTLQRLGKLIGERRARELALTARALSGAEAQEIGLVNTAFETDEEMLAGARKVAETIAAKSPLTVRGTKEVLLYARDHPTYDALNQVALWNSSMLFSTDLKEAMEAAMQKRPPSYPSA